MWVKMQKSVEKRKNAEKWGNAGKNAEKWEYVGENAEKCGK